MGDQISVEMIHMANEENTFSSSSVFLFDKLTPLAAPLLIVDPQVPKIEIVK